ncbi:FAD-dependent oxidoreductase [Planctomonas psychrotolerans]|uniref:FAD-dependent oxidoreductase n=1 Tax=Planctomonas psychrotolerans TaxID=2528712 RepID=UPI001239F0D0|nr:FAD-dependent oxidoreductase [Planctomonas psychrotolerans]
MEGGNRTAIVCGAGIAGLTVARELAAAGWVVTVLERAPGPRDQGYMIDFFGPGFDAAERMGLLPRLRDVAYAFTLRLVDERGRERAAVDVDRVARAAAGRYVSIMRPDLEKALVASLPPSVRLLYGRTFTGVEQGRGEVSVTLDDGDTLRAAVLIGADGIHSAVRRAVFGPESQFVRFLGFHTFAYLTESASLRRRLGGEAGMTDSIDRFVGMYALRDGRVAVVGAHRTRVTARPADVRTAILDVYSGLGWLTPEALAACPPSSEVYYDTVAQVHMPGWCSGRVALVGDAGFAVSLLAGQGASMAIAGGATLASALIAAPTVDAGFARYEASMRPLVDEVQSAGRRAAGTFVPATVRARYLRRLAFRMLNQPVIGRILGARITGRTPRFRPNA